MPKIMPIGEFLCVVKTVGIDGILLDIALQ